MPKVGPTTTYLGDGLYAEFDGFQIRLFTERESGLHEVFLEGETITALVNFIHREEPDFFPANLKGPVK